MTEDLVDPAAALAADRLRAHAETLRHEADEVERLLGDLVTYHREDVWEGATATRFSDELARHESDLRSTHTGACAAIREAAARLDARAAQLGGGG